MSRGWIGLVTAPAMLLCALLVVAVAGQEAQAPEVKADTPPAAPAEAAGEEPKEADEPVHIEHADLVSYDPEKNMYFLSGNVHLRHKEKHLY